MNFRFNFPFVCHFWSHGKEEKKSCAMCIQLNRCHPRRLVPGAGVCVCVRTASVYNKFNEKEMRGNTCEICTLYVHHLLGLTQSQKSCFSNLACSQWKIPRRVQASNRQRNRNIQNARHRMWKRIKTPPEATSTDDRSQRRKSFRFITLYSALGHCLN